MDRDVEQRVIAVRRGRVAPTGSWLYAWVDLAKRSVVHVGGTGFDPELRAHIHLTDDDPALGRVKAHIPTAVDGDFDVLAFRLPPEVERSAAKVALTYALHDANLTTGIRPTVAAPLDDELNEDITVEVIDEIVRSVRRHLA